MTYKVIGIGGKLGHGKDAVADRLVENHGWVKMGMSDPLHDIYLKENRWIQVTEYISNDPLREVLFSPGFYRYQEIYEKIGYVRAKKIPQVRSDLQILGTDIGREMIDEDIWTNMMERRVEEHLANGAPGVVVTGIRFPNELGAIRALRGDLWWVDRPSLRDSENAGHLSENSVKTWMFNRIISNGGTLEDLWYTVDSLL